MWYDCFLEIQGPGAPKALEALTDEDGHLVFHRLIPPPPVIIKTLDPKFRADEDDEIALAYTGHSHFYPWAMHHWGCKGNPVKEVFHFTGAITFWVMGGAPYKAIQTLQSRFPDISIIFAAHHVEA